MFFNRFKTLCDHKGVSCKRAAEEMGLSNSIATKWKKTGATPQGETLNRIAEYFGVSVDFLLSSETQAQKHPVKAISDEDIKFALSGGEGGITDAQYEEVKKFVQFIKERDKNDQE